MVVKETMQIGKQDCHLGGGEGRGREGGEGGDDATQQPLKSKQLGRTREDKPLSGHTDNLGRENSRTPLHWGVGQHRE